MFACSGQLLSVSRLDDILWTVEWLFEDGSCTIAQTYNSTPVSSAYASHMNRKAMRGVKRKASSLSEPAVHGEDERILPEDTASRHPAKRSAGQESTVDADVVESVESHNDGETVEDPVATPASDDELDAEDEIPPLPEAPEEKNAEIHTPFIYLVKPRTRGSRRVLIPVDVGQTVGDALRNNEVDEFPSFQTLSSPPESLPDGFILLADYLETPQTNNDHLKGLVSSDAGMAAGDESLAIPNCKDILATVKRDIGHLV
jgi:hypothetical protein